MWYSNDHYELRGKGSHLELSKDRTKIFEGDLKIIVIF